MSSDTHADTPALHAAVTRTRADLMMQHPGADWLIGHLYERLLDAEHERDRERARADRAEGERDEAADIITSDLSTYGPIERLAKRADRAEAALRKIERLPGYTVSAPVYERTAATTSSVWDAVAIARAALSVGSGGRETRPEGHEGMVTVYDHKGGYLGCMGRETWEKAVADEAQRRKTSP